MTELTVSAMVALAQLAGADLPTFEPIRPVPPCEESERGRPTNAWQYNTGIEINWCRHA